jgi:hypothetical protein
VLEWFWRGRALRELKANQVESAAAKDLAMRARLLFELGERASKPAESLSSPAQAAAAELYRESAYFAARALAADSTTGPQPWPHLDAALLERALGSNDQQAVVALVEESDFIALWSLTREEQAQRAHQLASVAKGLIAELDWRSRAKDGLWIQRLIRVGGLFALILGILLTVRAFSDSAEKARDLASGKAWRTSSQAGGFGCTSPQQQCGENNDFFFHTQEEQDPWVEIDLGKATRFSAVRVVNRRDCCFDRAVPLVIEVSSDQQAWREIARRPTSFSSWLAEVPSTKARYVRVRAANRTILHLATVRVLR